MWSFVQSKVHKCWIWLGICRFTKLIVGFATGGRGIKTGKKFWNNISPHCQDTQIFPTDLAILTLYPKKSTTLAKIRLLLLKDIMLVLEMT
jgi:hypothetical protein